jgi:hypothetical protein
LFLGLEEAPGVKNGLENWDWLVIVIPPTVPWKASMVICTTRWTVYRADSMCWGNRSQSVLTINLSIHSNIVEDSDERRVFNKISATCFPNSRFMDFHQLAVYPAFSFCLCKWCTVLKLHKFPATLSLVKLDFEIYSSR